jgi:ribonuclease HI
MIQVFTDGSCYNKTKQGGCAYYIIHENNTEQFFSKGYNNTTISRMEMRAVLEAMKVIKDKTKNITFYCDSEFVVNSFNKGWLDSWQRMSFVTCKNPDLWKEIVKEKQKFADKLIFEHTKGHRKDLDNPIALGNSICDVLCQYNSFDNYEIDLK